VSYAKDPGSATNGQYGLFGETWIDAVKGDFLYVPQGGIHAFGGLQVSQVTCSGEGFHGDLQALQEGPEIRRDDLDVACEGDAVLDAALAQPVDRPRLGRGDRVESATAVTAEDQHVKFMRRADATGLSIGCLAGYQVSGVDEVTVADVRQGRLPDPAIEVDQVSCGPRHDGLKRSQCLLRSWRSQLVQARFEAEP
jgi:hypothetical protein